MATLDKLVRLFLRKPPEVTFAQADRLLTAFDFVKVPGGGSGHQIFRHSDSRKISIPTVSGRRVKRTYVIQIVDLLDLEAWYEDR
jgi:predicted RNA binding protein YcfA (HicA-like mRNA interferase family)